MVTNADVEDLMARFPIEDGLNFDQEARLLVENGIFPIQTNGLIHAFPVWGHYLVSVPSLNNPGKLHRVVVDANQDLGEYILYDPQKGNEDKLFYPADGIQTGEAPALEVTFLNREILAGLQIVKPEV